MLRSRVFVAAAVFGVFFPASEHALAETPFGVSGRISVNVPTNTNAPAQSSNKSYDSLTYQDNGSSSLNNDGLYGGVSASVTGTHFGSSQSASAVSRSDLYAGNLGVDAQSTKNCNDNGVCGYSSAYGLAQLNDTIFLNKAPGNGPGPVRIGIHFETDGFTSGDSTHFFQATTRYDNKSGVVVGSVQSGNLVYDSFNWARSSWVGERSNIGYNIFSGDMYFDVVADFFTIDMRLEGGATSGGLALLSNTAKIGLILPDGVTFSSASGSFLSKTAGTVPEPSTWMVMILGVALIGSRLRKQNRNFAVA